MQWMSWIRGLAYTARHVIGCHVIQEDLGLMTWRVL